jgi:hypothetical protein
MGYGDEGLLRANFWGKRKVYGYVVDSGNSTSLDYYDIPAPKWATTGLQKMQHMQKTLQTPDVFDISLGRGSDASLISALQDVLQELGYLEESNGKYDSDTISGVYDFQIEHEIVSSESEQ